MSDADAAPGSPPKRILVVEDHEDSRELLVDFFANAGFVVVARGTAAEGMDCLRTEPFDCVITDYMLGRAVETGCWMLARAAGEGLLRATKAIIIYTAHPHVSAPASIARARVILKPVGPDSLCTEVEHLIAEAQAASAARLRVARRVDVAPIGE